MHKFLSLLTFFSTCAFAQTLTISSINGSGTFVDQDYFTTITGSGTASISTGGNATFTLTSTDTRDRGINCNAANVIQLALTFTFNSTDSLTILSSQNTSNTGGASSIALSGNFNVTGGTGAYAGKGGSGTLAIIVVPSSKGGGGSSGGNAGTFTVTGTGTGILTSQLVPQPTINPSGIVPVFGGVPIIQPGSWISIYGANFASSTSVWNGNFPTSLGGVSVAIDGKLGYLWFVSPGQINLQAPDDASPGCVNVVVNTPNGQANYGVMLQPQGPSLSLWGGTKYAAAIIYTSAGYDLLAPAGAVAGATTRPVKVGETISLYGVGFGPTKSPAPAGQAYTGPSQNNLVEGVSVTIGGKNANVTFSGLVAEGLYQVNVVVPQVASGDELVQATLFFSNPILGDNTITQNDVYIAVQ